MNDQPQNLQQQLLAAQNRANQLEQQVQAMQAQQAQEAQKATFASLMSQAGADDANQLYILAKHQMGDKLNTLLSNEQPDRKQTSELINEVRQAFPKYFKSSAGNPGTPRQAAPTEQDQMSAEYRQRLRNRWGRW